MALNSWLTSLKLDVSDVSAVQPSIHAGCSRYGTETAAVSDVSAEAETMRTDTADTVAKMQAYQRKPAPVLACTPDTADTFEKIVTGADSANEAQAALARSCGRSIRGRNSGGWPGHSASLPLGIFQDHQSSHPRNKSPFGTKSKSANQISHLIPLKSGHVFRLWGGHFVRPKIGATF